MALSHILSAITAESDAQLSELQATHAARMKQMEEKHQEQLSSMKATVTQQKTQRKHQLKKRTEGHIDMLTRHAVLQRKQELLNELFNGVATTLAKLSDQDAERMLTSWMKTLPKGGKLIPSKKHEALVKKIAGNAYTVDAAGTFAGGFQYIGEKEDRNYTFEFLVEHVLRPSVEIEAASKLFATK